MQTLKAVYANEMFKISKKKKIKSALIFSLLSVIVAAVVVYSLNNFAGVSVTGSSDFSVMVLTVLSYSLFPLFTAFVCIDIFAGEFADNTIKFTLTGPASRLKVFCGKILAVGTFIIINLMVTAFFSFLFSLFINGGVSNPLRIITSYIMAFLPIFIFALMVALISNFSKGTTSAFMLSIFVFLVFNGLSLAFPLIRSFVFTSSFDWYKLVLGSYINFGKIFRMFLILVGYGIMLFAAGYYQFEKKDI
jgi:ABC-2 type transport system permease protein